MCLDGEKNDRVAFQARADYQNHAIGWLHRGYSSLGGGKVVRFPRIWMVYGECRINYLAGHEPIEVVMNFYRIDRVKFRYAARFSAPSTQDEGTKAVHHDPPQ